MIQSIVLGIIEGLTEFLPISSTGHLILTARLLNLPQTEFLKTFEIVIQLGAIFAVVFIYWKTILKDMEAMKRIAVAFVPTAIIGLLLYKIFKQYFFSEWVVVIALFVGGIVLIIFEMLHKEKEGAESEIKQISYRKSFLIGIFQSIAIVPGVSRSAATIIGGLSMGIKRKAIVEFSFLLAIPTMLAATAYDMLKSAPTFSSTDFGSLAIGFVTSFIVALFAVKWLIKYIEKNNFIAFGVYRIVLAILFFLVFLR